MTTEKLKKKQKLRNNEYYHTQKVYDELYLQSQNNQKFYDLLDIIESEENILLAYRNIKKNKGSKTGGTNKKTILDIRLDKSEELIRYVRRRLSNFRPHSIRRVEIEKDNGKKRPLGIPTIEDRLIQQCIKQVLEPICEAKFHKHSYGFRPNRGAHHAIARAMFLTNKQDFQYVVDIDIKGFFDNVNHGKLLKQLWSLGVRDKKLLSIISKMLKADIKGIGKPTKGTPQGGILSPLLSNVVLNELDWWLSNQWETAKTRHNYSKPDNKYPPLRKSRLKEFFFVRYADDFKIFCKTRSTANKIFAATRLWLKERLDLDISPEKSKIVNLKRQYSEFLGFKLKLIRKADKYVIESRMTEKSIKRTKIKIRECLKLLQHEPTEYVHKYNAKVLGLHNYYKVATKVSRDFNKIAFEVSKNLYNRTKRVSSKQGTKSKAYIKYYGGSNGKVQYVKNVALFPIWYIRTSPPMCFSQTICNYTIEGRLKIHDNLQSVDIRMLQYLMKHPLTLASTELNDNRISLYVGQLGKCFVTGERLKVNEMEVHHKLPKSMGGGDEYGNLVYVSKTIHKLIHSVEPDTIEKYLIKAKNESVKICFSKLNTLRVLVGNCELNEHK